MSWLMLLVRKNCGSKDRKSTRLNSSHTVIYTLSLHDALPICRQAQPSQCFLEPLIRLIRVGDELVNALGTEELWVQRSEEHTSELQSHRDLHSFPTRRSSDLPSGSAIAMFS